MNIEKHLTLLGVLHLVHSGLGMFTGMAIFGLLAGIGAVSGDATALAVLGSIGTVIGAFLFFISIPGIIAGAGILMRKSWSRVFTLVIGALCLIDIPFGTALGIYTFWVLLKDEAPAALGVKVVPPMQQ